MYVWIKKLNEATLDPTTGETQDQFLHRKMQTLAALQAVCGFLPHAKVKQIINSEIYHSGRHQAAALQALMLRVRFLRDVLLEASLFSSPMDSVGALQKAVEYNDEIDFIARLPFAGDITVRSPDSLSPCKRRWTRSWRWPSGKRSSRRRTVR